MSAVLAKRRKTKGDNYRTPHWCTNVLVNECPEFLKKTVDPCPGQYGSITEAVPEIRSINGDALNFTYEGMNIVTNPPYSIVDKIMEQFFKTCTGKIALFLPLEYISVKKRQRYYRYIEKLIIFTLRMDLTKWRGGDKVDFGAVTYAWFVFNPKEDKGGRFDSILIECHNKYFSKRVKK